MVFSRVFPSHRTVFHRPESKINRFQAIASLAFLFYFLLHENNPPTTHNRVRHTNIGDSGSNFEHVGRAQQSNWTNNNKSDIIATCIRRKMQTISDTISKVEEIKNFSTAISLAAAYFDYNLNPEHRTASWFSFIVTAIRFVTIVISTKPG